MSAQVWVFRCAVKHVFTISLISSLILCTSSWCTGVLCWLPYCVQAPGVQGCFAGCPTVYKLLVYSGCCAGCPTVYKLLVYSGCCAGCPTVYKLLVYSGCCAGCPAVYKLLVYRGTVLAALLCTSSWCTGVLCWLSYCVQAPNVQWALCWLPYMRTNVDVVINSAPRYLVCLPVWISHSLFVPLSCIFQVSLVTCSTYVRR